MDNNKCVNENKWFLEFGDYKFDMKDDSNREKSLALGRFLGYVASSGISRGHPKINENEITVFACSTVDMNINSIVNMNNIANDIELFTGEKAKIEEDLYMFNASHFNLPAPRGPTSTTWMGISTNDKFAKSFLKLPKSSYNYPDFLFDDNCPLVIIREFLGGNFGGDADYYKDEVRMPKDVDFLCIKKIQFLMIKLNVDIATEIYFNLKTGVIKNFMIKVINKDIFHENIGFRYRQKYVIANTLIYI